MCYYSMEGSTRDAKKDEVLIVGKVAHERKGLVSPEDCATGVCLRSGARVELLFIPEHTQKRYQLGLEESATFRMRYWLRRDILLLDNGTRIPIQKLEMGQVIRILQLPVTAGEEVQPESANGSRETHDAVHAARLD